MDNRAIDFLNNFPAETRAQIIDFGKRISSDELKADVYIVMARKAICLVDLLIQFKLAYLNGVVVSERVLDTNVEWLEGKNIVIVDDALVSGTSIKKVIDKLEQRHPASIKVCVLCVNKKWYNPDMLTRCDGSTYLVNPINYQTTEKCMKTCYDIVRAFSTVPKPYDIDFPLYDDIYITERKLNEVLNNSWISVNVTSNVNTTSSYFRESIPLNEINNSFASVTLFPPQYIEEKVWNMMGLSKCSGNLKMRIYIRKREKKKAEYHVSFLPFAVIERLSNEEIDNIMEQLFVKDDKFECAKKCLITYESKFRVIQFVAAIVLAREFFATTDLYDIDPSSGVICFPKNSLTRAAYIFSNEILHLIEKFNCVKVNEHILKCGGDNKIAKNLSLDRDINTLSYNEKMASMFIKLYNDEEIPARELAKKYGKHVFEIEEYQKVMNRLERGYTFKQIVDKIESLNNCKYIASVFLDYAVDAGIAVPIIFPQKDGVSRAYRHGEDVIFSDSEAKHLSFMLHTFMKDCSKEDGLGAVFVEKLFTTFIRLGLNVRLFSQYDYGEIESRHRDFLRIVYNLHGSTVRKYQNNIHDEEIVRPYVTADDKSLWLRDVLIEKSLLEYQTKATEVADKNDENRLLVVPKEKQGELQEEYQDLPEGAIAERIAITLAYFYKRGLLKAEDLTLINATLGYEQILPALLAEIEIIQSEYKKSFRYFLQKEFHSEYTLNWLKSQRNSKFFKAMNSGKWKANNFNNDYARKKIKELRDEAAKDTTNRSMYLNWREFWEEKLSNVSQEVTPEIRELYSTISIYLIQYGLIFRILEYLACLKKDISKQVETYFFEITNAISQADFSKKRETLDTFNSNKKWSDVISYFSICGVDVNTKTVYDNDIVNDLKSYTYLITDIKKYIGLLENEDRQTNILETNVFLTKIQNILNSRTYENAFVECLIEQADSNNSKISFIQDRACLFINNKGKIEQPLLYNNIMLINFGNEASKMFKREIEATIKRRQKKIKRNAELFYQECKNGDFIIFTRGINTDKSLLLLSLEINKKYNIENNIKVVTALNIEESCCAVRYKSCMTSVNASNFFTWYGFIEDRINETDFAVALINNVENDDSISSICKDFDGVTSISYSRFNIEKELKVMYITKKNNENVCIKKGFRIGIICAKPTELSGVRKTIEEKFNVQFEEAFDEKENYRRYLSADVVVDALASFVILTLCGQGNTNAAIAYDSLAHFNLDYVFFCGIAGTSDSKVEIGDVFIPFLINDVTLKKETNDGFKLRGEAYRINANHKGLLESFTDNSKYEFKLSNEPAVSDNSVYATDDSEILKNVLAFNDKIACIEMESGGIYNADYTRHKTKHGVFTIRGISDNADSIKDDRFHELAINNASLVAADLLSFLFSNYSTIKNIK